jgi:AcrR family transcriptional regulator
MPASETRRDQRRREIVAAARAVVAEQGLEALTFATLEARLSFTRGVITYHFQDKDDIVYAVLDSAVEEINASLAAALRPEMQVRERIGLVLRTYVRGFVEHVEAGRILLAFWGRLGSDARARKVNARLYAGYRRGARRLLVEGLSTGELEGVDPDAMAGLLVGMVLGIATQTYFEAGAIDSDTVVAEAVRCVLAAALPASGKALTRARLRRV